MGEALITRRGGGGGGGIETIKDWTMLRSGIALGRRYNIDLTGRSLVGIKEIRLKGSNAFAITSSEITLDFDVPELYVTFTTSEYTGDIRVDFEVDLLFEDRTGNNMLHLYREANEWIYSLPTNKFLANTTYKFK